MLIGMDPLGIDAILHKMARIKKCRSAKALIDNALWDLKGKLLGQPVWRLLGGSTPKPVPISSIVFGYTSVAAMAKDRGRVIPVGADVSNAEECDDIFRLLRHCFSSLGEFQQQADL